MSRPGGQVRVSPQDQPIFRELGIDAEAVFDHELIKPWRTLSDRQNCTLQATLRDGRSVHWHIKRYTPPHGRRALTPADAEVAGLRLLIDRGIPTVRLVASGTLHDGRSFVILDDLAGFAPADTLVEAGLDFDRLLRPTAALAAKLHSSGLHHRDLYLCHFFARLSSDAQAVDLRLIDTARVRRLPRFLQHRWIVKDLAQFWYSTLRLRISDAQREQWLDHYAAARSLDAGGLRPKIRRKVLWIARHDQRTRQRRPMRNISIPT